MHFDVRPAKPEEYPVLWRLFHDTVHRVNRRDYTTPQLTAWAPEEVDLSRWGVRMQGIDPFVAIAEEQIVGFSDVQPNGLIDMFYVHHAWQRKGIGSRLFAEIDERARQMKLDKLHSHVSITARPFFETQGFQVVVPQEVIVNGVMIGNFVMSKSLSA
ncbi:GNAT family N-acetyltransferase [Blastopirellula marina]|uniref:GNAT family N-acetyltransferase n=1 Tax=Blastopirellula marina TaxID=124 RepID=A0A2S8F709_9BACT|nr:MULTISPECIES: GNAT family N-acetyltransferase [Pirellulaceae]PQO27935.1 GNAT family N-acetyltransferase [Blastopirellula marina]RCS48360.1 GNAT family N-acetyltransferase [Bremerella cremea]